MDSFQFMPALLQILFWWACMVYGVTLAGLAGHLLTQGRRQEHNPFKRHG